MAQFTVGYSTYEGSKREFETVEADSHREAGQIIEKNIRARGDTPKSIGPATENRSKVTQGSRVDRV